MSSRTVPCPKCGAPATLIEAPMFVRDRRTHEERWVTAEIAYCGCGTAMTVSLPPDALPLPEDRAPPGEAETAEGQEWLRLLRDSLRRGPGDYDVRRAVAEAWHALTRGGRLDASWALTREERAWLALAFDELLDAKKRNAKKPS